MKKRYGFGLIAALLILIIGICGCAANHADPTDEKEPEVTLSERQKDILAEQGLPTEYDALRPHQQRAIVAIEEMLLYAEDKYDLPFSYAGYTEAGPMEKEHMRAYPTSGHMAVDSFTITKTEARYEDDFVAVASSPYFASYVRENLKSFLPNSEVKVYAEITDTSLTEVPTAETVFDDKVASSLCIFVDGATCTVEDFESFKLQYADFMRQHRLYGMTQVILLKEGNLIYLSEFNYTDYLSADYFDSRDTISIQR